MTLTDRIASLFGEIAVAAGTFEAQHGTPPTRVVLSPAEAGAILEYIRLSDYGRLGHTPPPLTKSERRELCKRMLVSGLRVVVWAGARRLHVA